MGQGEVRRIVLATQLQWNHMVNVQGILVHNQINGLLADKALALLRCVQSLNQCCSVFWGLPVKKK
jgi:hypothetical protein